MKRKLPQLLLWLLSCSSILSSHGWSQSVITSWDFNDGTTATTIGNGALQTLGNVHTAFPTSSYGKCLQLSNFANQYTSSGTHGIELSVNTTGYSAVVLNFSQRAANQASRWAQIDYSTDGSTWHTGFWINSGSLSPDGHWQDYSVNFGSVSTAENNPNFRVRIVSIFSPYAFDQSNQTATYAAHTAYMIAQNTAVYSPSISSNNTNYSTNGSWRFDNISVVAQPIPVWANTQLASPMASVYGTSSSEVAYTLNLANSTAAIDVAPIAGFEISTQAASGYSSNPLTNLANGTTIYVRTIYNKSVGTFNASPCLTLSSLAVAPATVNCSASNNVVTQKPLSIIASDVNKELGQVLVGGSGQLGFSTSGLISGEAILSLTLAYGPAGASTGVGAVVGVYANQVFPSLAVGSFLASNYLISYLEGSIIVSGFSPGNLIVNRIGDGVNPLGSIAFPLRLQEFIPNGTLVQTLEQQFDNANLLTETGELNVSTGYLNSVDNLVGIPGFAAAPGTNDLAQTQPKVTNILSTGAAVSTRVVFPTSGATLPFIDGYLTSLIPLPNNCFYAAGIGSAGSGGIWYFDGVNFIQLTAAFAAIRTLEVFNEELYFSTAEIPAGIYQVGSGLPTASGQAVSLVLETPSPRGFSLSPDGLSAYVADDQPINGQNGGGIQKWTQQNGVWSKNYTHGHRANGLLVDYSDSLAKVYASTFLASPGQDNNKLIALTDSSQNAAVQELSSSGTQFIYKGLDFSPAPPPASPQIAQVEQPSCANGYGKVHFSNLPAGQWRITGFPGGSKTGTGTTALIDQLNPGQSYTFKVTSYTGRSSTLSTAVQIQAAPEVPTEPTGSQIQQRCQGALLADLSLNQSNLVWYPSSSSTTALAATLPLVHQAHYFAAQTAANGCQSLNRLEVEALVLPSGAWKGAQQGSWKQAVNWCGGVPANGASVFIPESTTVFLDTTAALALLTVAPGAHLKLKETHQLSLDGDIAVHGQLTLENKATIVQGANSSWTGNGTVQLQQAITGSGQNTPNGRYWFVGTPMPAVVSSTFGAQTASVLKYFNEPLGNWQEITDAQTPIEVGKGYFVQSATDDTLLFNGSTLNNGNYNIPCTRTGTTNYYRGFNLVSNPYASYLDFDAAIRTNLLPTMWYRTADPLQNMVFDTYNAQSGLGTSLSGIAVNQFVPPLQSFWVKIPDGYTTGSIAFTNAMRAHHTIGFEGLKSTAIDFPAFVRINLEDGLRKDQLIVYMDQQVSSQVDGFDAEKMLVVNYPQCYTMASGKKMVINALKLSKAHNEIPLIVEFPESKSYVLNAVELNIDNGLILLEDKQLGVFQDLTQEPMYTFFATSGVESTRFVLHLNVPQGFLNHPLLEPSIATQEAITGPLISVTYDPQNDIVIELDAAYSAEGQLELFDQTGRLVNQKTIEQHLENLPAPTVPGYYLLRATIQGLVFTKQIVIN
ncbi:MAG: hypothetical protein RIR94_1805 [Bacteroidota bacterium]